MTKSPKEVSEKALEAVRLAKQSGAIRKGVNEVTKSIERGLASLVVIAEDVQPEEVVMHLPGLCEQKRITYVYAPTKLEIGKAIGMNVPCSSVAIEKAGEGESAMKDVIAKTTGRSHESKAAPVAAETKKEEKKEKQPKKETPK